MAVHICARDHFMRLAGGCAVSACLQAACGAAAAASTGRCGAAVTEDITHKSTYLPPSTARRTHGTPLFAPKIKNHK